MKTRTALRNILEAEESEIDQLPDWHAAQARAIRKMAKQV